MIDCFLIFHAETDSLLHTPNVFKICVMGALTNLYNLFTTKVTTKRTYLPILKYTLSNMCANGRLKCYLLIV